MVLPSTTATATATTAAENNAVKQNPTQQQLHQKKAHIRFQPPSKPPPSIKHHQQQQQIHLQPSTVLVNAAAEEQQPRPHPLQRSATLPANTKRLGIRNRVTFHVPTAGAAGIVEKSPNNINNNNNNNENSSINQLPVAQQSNTKMTSEDLLQPGHVVKERWKVCTPVLDNFIKNLIFLI